MQFKARIHELLDFHDYHIDENSISFEDRIEEEDIEELKDLHDEWFPIVYSRSFYSSIVDGTTRILVMRGDVVLRATKDPDEQGFGVYPQVRRVILALVTFKVKDQSSRYISVLEKIKSIFKKSHSIEILTFGVLYEFRKLSLGSRVMTKLISLTKVEYREMHISYFKLQVIEHNHSAIRFYLKNGFKLFETQIDYYTIDGVKYNCLKLIKKL